MFNVNSQIIRGLIFLSVINLAVVTMFAWSRLEGTALGFIRPTIALYGLLATILALRITWPHGKTTAGYLFVAMVLASLLEGAIQTGYFFGWLELLTLLTLTLIPAVLTILDRSGGGPDLQVSITRSSILVILTWIYVIAALATVGEDGAVIYVYHFVSLNSLTALTIYAASPFLKSGGDTDASSKCE